MSQDSAIEWTDATWNPVRGCTKVSPGCANCYAETFAERWRGVPGHPYEQGFDLRLVPEKLDEPLRWRKPRRVFVNSMSDLFQDGVPDAFIDRVFAVMAIAQWHTFQVLTKRPARMLAYLKTLPMKSGEPDRITDAALEIGIAFKRGQQGWAGATARPLPNVWLGVSVENQHFADERIPLLLQTPAAVRFISAEPLLGAVDVEPWLHRYRQRRGLACAAYASSPSQPIVPALDWVIVGGESGNGARPFDVAWARSIVDQCKAAGVPVFVKQLGANAYDGAQQSCDAATCCVHDYTKLQLAKKGGDPAEWPEDLRVREFPAVKP